METIRYTTVQLEPLGSVHVGYTSRGLAYLTAFCRSDAEFAAQVRDRYGCSVVRDDGQGPLWQAALTAWLAGQPCDVKLDLTGVTAWERQVMLRTMEIRRGSVRPYIWLAQAVGKPGGSRAVGNVMARNPLPLLVPCHRVVAASGVIGNYSLGGPEIKRRLLEIEGVDLSRLRELIATPAATAAAGQP